MANLPSLFELFFPNLCYGCDAILHGSSQFLCLNCLSTLPETNMAAVSYNNVMVQKLMGRAKLEHAFALYAYTKGNNVQRLIYALKYYGQEQVGQFLGELMAEEILKHQLTNVDYVVPVPLHPKKLKLRGYNQAEILAKAIAEKNNLPLSPNLIQRAVYQQSQTKKTRDARIENVNHAFVVDPNLKEEVLDKHILLVDDVFTTGSTVEACNAALTEVLGQSNYKLSVVCLAHSVS